jgi:hypothetical protein
MTKAVAIHEEVLSDLLFNRPYSSGRCADMFNFVAGFFVRAEESLSRRLDMADRTVNHNDGHLMFYFEGALRDSMSHARKLDTWFSCWRSLQ